MRITLHFKHKQYWHPPQIDFLCDLELINSAAVAQWLLLPRALLTPFMTTRTVNGVSLYALAGEGQVFNGRFEGLANCQTFYLPPAAHLLIQEFALSLFEPDPGETPIPVPYMTATALHIANDPVQTWLDHPLLCDQKGQVRGNQPHLLNAKHTPDRSEVPLQVQNEQMSMSQLHLTT